MKSHILPDFLFKKMKDERGRLTKLSGDHEVPEKLIQSAPKEKALCAECDNVYLADLEKYACQVIYGGGKRSPSVQNSEDGLVLTRLDYRKLKLFYLSMLWRMSIASDEFFTEVDLGKYKLQAHKMLSQRNPGKENQFSIVCVLPLLNGKLLDATLQPRRIKDTDGTDGTRYSVLIDGMLHIFFVGNRSIQEPLGEFLLREDGTWKIPRLNSCDIPFLQNDLQQFSTAMKQRKYSTHD